MKRILCIGLLLMGSGVSAMGGLAPVQVKWDDQVAGFENASLVCVDTTSQGFLLSGSEAPLRFAPLVVGGEGLAGYTHSPIGRDATEALGLPNPAQQSDFDALLAEVRAQEQELTQERARAQAAAQDVLQDCLNAALQSANGKGVYEALRAGAVFDADAQAIFQEKGTRDVVDNMLYADQRLRAVCTELKPEFKGLV